MTEQTLPPMRAAHDWPTHAGSWAYDTWGTHGRPVVLLPTILFERHCWWPVAADLRPYASVIAVDLPGHGGSTPRHRHEPDTLVDDLAALIAHLAIAQASVIVGHASSAGLATLRRPPATGALPSTASHHQARRLGRGRLAVLGVRRVGPVRPADRR